MRHEKIILVVLAYVIGFNTAFIAFGLSQIQTNERSVVYATKVRAVTNQEHEGQNTQELAPTQQEANVVRVLEDQDAFYALVGTDKRVLTARVTDVVTPKDGAYVAIPIYTVSPDGAYIHFCEQQSMEEQTCKHFIYTVAEHVLHRVKYNNEQYTSSVNSLEGSWSNEGHLLFEGLTSADTKRPWLLVEDAL